jgi:PIN like domain
MSTESESKKSGLPPASSWATPPEFYADENVVTRSVRGLLTGLGYTVHTPWELYGSRDAAMGALDEDWLQKVSGHPWTILGRDLKIYERPAELEAYRRARVQVFLLPGQATSAQLVHLVEINLARMCAIATTRQPGTWRLTETGPQPYDIPRKPRKRRK